MRVVARQIARNAETLDTSDLRRAAVLRDADVLRERLNELAIAQEYQDLTGQIIKRIIALVEDVEGALLELPGAHATHLKPPAPLPIPERQVVMAGPAVPGLITTSPQGADALLRSIGVWTVPGHPVRQVALPAAWDSRRGSSRARRRGRE